MERYLGHVVLQGCASWTTELVVWCESEFVHVLYLYRGECRLVSKCLGCWALGGTNPSGGGGCWGVVGGGGSGSGENASCIVFGGVCSWNVIRVLVVMTDCIGQRPVSRAGSCGGVVLVPPLLMCIHVGDRNVKRCLMVLESLKAADL